MKTSEVFATAPTTRGEAVELSGRASRWRTCRVDAQGHLRSKGTRFSAASCTSLEAMLTASGWTFVPRAEWHDDARERFVSIACCWRHADPNADWSTFVRAVRLTADALAGRFRLAGVSAILVATVAA